MENMKRKKLFNLWFSLRYKTNMEALFETARKIYDLKKPSVGSIHGGIRIYYPKHR